ncbi:CGNR zinc finger domain-containing protein [Salinifilum ghardaiensis]
MNSRAVAPVMDNPPVVDSAGPTVEHDLELVLAFLNTYDAETGTELLRDHVRWRHWCLERGLGIPSSTEPTLQAREAMRTAVTLGSLPDTAVPHAWPVRVELRQGLPVLSGTDALGTVLVAAIRLVHTGHWNRIKICPAEDCLSAFYDRSRNRSRTWCSMRVCGNREKARLWRERHTGDLARDKTRD